MRNTLKSILNRVSKVIHRINAPLVACSVMLESVNSVDNRITHIKVTRRKVNLCTESHFAVLKFAVFHSLKQIKAFFYRTVTIRTLCRSLCVASVFSHLVGSKLANICKSLFDKLNGKFIHLIKIL